MLQSTIPMHGASSLQENLDIFPKNDRKKFREYLWKKYFNIVDKF